MSRVIINGDDFGYSMGVNYGIIETFSKGILTSATLMANMPGFDHAVSLSKKYPGLGVGIHLVLTCGEPVLKTINSLTDEKGVFRKLESFQTNVLIDIEELYQEWDAQIQKIYQAGVTPSHLDSHHHVHSRGDIQKVFVKLAKKYKLPVRGNFEQKEGIKSTLKFEPHFDLVGDPENMKKNLGVEFEEYLENLMNDIRHSETIEIMCHPAYIDNVLYNNSDFIFPRIHLVDFLINSKFAETLKTDKSIKLINFHQV